ETETKVGEVTTKSATPKLESEYNDEDLKKLSLNFKAINFLHCALNENDYMKITNCKIAKEIWDKLEVHMKEQLM
ncbi:hypothetical protein PIB30_099512, partial [Stylosanthes scabra]|nr:hypothetical protein [Stylosanthes scabra]